MEFSENVNLSLVFNSIEILSVETKRVLRATSSTETEQVALWIRHEDRLGLDFGTVAAFDIDLGKLLSVVPRSQRQFAPLFRFPAASRDLALVVPMDVTAGRVSDIIHRHRLVVGAELFDIYAGDNIAEGAKSLAFHVYFQASDRTLTNDEVNRSLDGLLRTLEREVNASLRS